MKLQLVPSICRTAYYYARRQALDVRSWRQLVDQPEFQGATLAIVGNAGYLSEQRQGTLIDSHDLVLRMNNFRTAGYERQVGRRTDIFMTTFHSNVVLDNPELKEARWIVASMPMNFAKDRPSGLQQRHGEFITAGLLRMKRRTVFIPEIEQFLQVRQRIGRYPTTGAMALLLAAEYLLPACKSIYVTGFSFFEGRSHYFSDRQVSAANHDLQREQQFARDLLATKLISRHVRLDAQLEARLLSSTSGRVAA